MRGACGSCGTCKWWKPEAATADGKNTEGECKATDTDLVRIDRVVTAKLMTRNGFGCVQWERT
jgi:hypothetical protein